MKKYIVDILKEINAFNKFILNRKPKDEAIHKSKFLHILPFNVINHLIGIFITLFILFVLTFLLKYFEGLHSVQKQFVSPSFKDASPWMLFIFTAFIGPVCEEFAFRYPLAFKRYSMVIGLFFFSMIVIFSSQLATINIANIGLRAWILEKSTKIITLSSVIIFSLVLFSLLKQKTIDKIALFWQKHVYYIVLLLSINFALGHSTLPLYLVNIPWIIGITFKQFYSAMTYSYIRLKYGFLYTVLCHILWNLPSALSFLLFNEHV